MVTWYCRAVYSRPLVGGPGHTCIRSPLISGVHAVSLHVIAAYSGLMIRVRYAVGSDCGLPCIILLQSLISAVVVVSVIVILIAACRRPAFLANAGRESSRRSNELSSCSVSGHDCRKSGMNSGCDRACCSDVLPKISRISVGRVA